MRRQSPRGKRHTQIGVAGVQKLFVWISGGVFLMCFGGTMYVRQYQTRNRPDTPQPAVGFVYPLDANYGKTVYISASDWGMRVSAYAALAASGVALIAASLYARKRQ